MTEAICEIRSADMRAWLEKMRPEMLCIREHLILHRQERAPRVDEVDARKPILERDSVARRCFLTVTG